MARGNGRRPAQTTVDTPSGASGNGVLKIDDFFEVEKLLKIEPPSPDTSTVIPNESHANVKSERCDSPAEAAAATPTPLTPTAPLSKIQKENVPSTPNKTARDDDGKPRKRTRAPRQPKKKVTTVTPKKEEAVIEPSKEKFITDYFQPRRSRRQTKAEQLKSKLIQMQEKIIHEDESGFEVVEFEGKGRGVVAKHDLKIGDFVLEYAGDLISIKQAKEREETYATDTAVGCYMYYFQHENNNYCIDATQESNRLGRLINHSIKGANLKTKSVSVGGRARLVFLAKKDISLGQELLYDYGDRSKVSLQSHPWLKN